MHWSSEYPPSSVMLKKLSFDGTDSDVVLEAELTAAYAIELRKNKGVSMCDLNRKENLESNWNCRTRDVCHSNKMSQIDDGRAL